MRLPSAPNLASVGLASSGLAVLLLACGPTPLPLDAGDEAGARRAMPSCVNPLEVAGMTGMVAVDIDTRFGEAGLISLPGGAFGGCTSSSDPPAPQMVIAYLVPGTGTQSIEVSTVNPSTDRNFDTVIAVRGTQCWPANADEPPLFCFDDEEASREFRSRGSFTAEGGTTVYLVVTGYGAMVGGRADEGLASLEIVAQALSPPTIDSASVLLTDTSVRVDVVGGDPGRDATGVWLTFHGPAGEQLDLDSNGVFDERDVLTGPFDRPVLGSPTFTEIATLPPGPVGGAALVRVRLIDRPGTLSERAVTVPGRMGTVVGLGDPCSATNVCGPELACNAMMVCSAAPDRVAGCAAAIAIDLTAPADGRATITTRQSVLTSGAGLFSSPSGCASSATGGREDIFSVRVPPGRFDVMLTTDSPGTAGAIPEPDTVLYVRRTCTDAGPTSALDTECNDDIAGSMNLRSTVEIADLGDVELSVFVEIYNGAPEGPGIRYELAVTLRPVLDPGAMCDPAGLENRCAMGTCPVATRVCT